jgi:multicomponent Na+:H+ antiporter subunit A
VIPDMTWLILIHVLAGAAILMARRTLGRKSFLIGAVGPVSVLVWAIGRAGAILDGTPYAQTLEWVPALDLSLAFRVDSYALLFLLVIGVAGTAIFLYAAAYFGSSERVATFAAVMTLFGGAMVGLVGADHLLAVFVFWELTTITSFLLIGYDDAKAEARAAALQAALVTGAGGLAMLGGLVMLGSAAGTFRISELVTAPPAASAATTVAWVLILIGAVTKSAQFPFHGWLPGAMAAPTPASAFLHSATMVKAGIFLAGRLAPAAVESTGWWTPAVLTIGFVTMGVGGWRALRQHDLKLLLAFGTVSQLGFLFLLVGSGVPKLLYGGLALLAAHALFKAALFMVVGTIDHEAGTRDLRRLSNLRRSMPAVFAAGTMAGLSMAAVPLTFGFAAKEAAFDGLLGRSPWLVALAAAASVLTVVYTGRFLLGAFGAHHEGHEPAGQDAHTPRSVLLWSPLVLAAVGVVFGVVPGSMAGLIDAASTAVSGVEKAGKLVLWPGLVPALGWSLASLTLGSILVWRSRIVDAITDRVSVFVRPLPTAEGSYRRSLAGLLTFADRSSSLIQNGSLPSYIGIISLVAVLLPATALVGAPFPASLPPTGGVLEVLLAVVILASAAGLLFIRRRFAAVILLGGVGYGVAGLYAVLGGPDLSLTQLLVETLAIALFALVLRHLPATFAKPRAAQLPRVLIAAAVGVFVFAGGLLTAGTQSRQPVSDLYLEASVPEAGGANVVNVILVDFRGFDTLGEITVLATAALGAAALVIPILRRWKTAAP